MIYRCHALAIAMLVGTLSACGGGGVWHEFDLTRAEVQSLSPTTAEPGATATEWESFGSPWPTGVLGAANAPITMPLTAQIVMPDQSGRYWALSLNFNSNACGDTTSGPNSGACPADAVGYALGQACNASPLPQGLLFCNPRESEVRDFLAQLTPSAPAYPQPYAGPGSPSPTLPPNSNSGFAQSPMNPWAPNGQNPTQQPSGSFTPVPNEPGYVYAPFTGEWLPKGRWADIYYGDDSWFVSPHFQLAKAVFERLQPRYGELIRMEKCADVFTKSWSDQSYLTNNKMPDVYFRRGLDLSNVSPTDRGGGTTNVLYNPSLSMEENIAKEAAYIIRWIEGAVDAVGVVRP